MNKEDTRKFTYTLTMQGNVQTDLNLKGSLPLKQGLVRSYS